MPNGQIKERVTIGTVSFWLKIVGVTVAVIMFIVSPNYTNEKNIALIQKDIEDIKSNHMTHLQNYAEEIKNLKVEQVDQEKEIDDIKLQLNTIITLLGGEKVQ